MEHQVIPAEAVRAAHAAICEQNLDDCLDPDWRGKCVKAVEAAAPYIRAQAFDEAASKLRSDMEVPQRIWVSRKVTALAMIERGDS